MIKTFIVKNISKEKIEIKSNDYILNFYEDKNNDDYYVYLNGSKLNLGLGTIKYIFYSNLIESLNARLDKILKNPFYKSDFSEIKKMKDLLRLMNSKILSFLSKTVEFNKNKSYFYIISEFNDNKYEDNISVMEIKKYEYKNIPYTEFKFKCILRENHHIIQVKNDYLNSFEEHFKDEITLNDLLFLNENYKNLLDIRYDSLYYKISQDYFKNLENHILKLI